jgi:hypothetical protein
MTISAYISLWNPCRRERALQYIPPQTRKFWKNTMSYIVTAKKESSEHGYKVEYGTKLREGEMLLYMELSSILCVCHERESRARNLSLKEKGLWERTGSEKSHRRELKEQELCKVCIGR